MIAPQPKLLVAGLESVTKVKDCELVENLIDDLVLALPDDFVWSRDFRRRYNKAVKIITKLKAEAKVSNLVTRRN